MDKQSLLRAALQAVIIGVIVGAVVLAGFEGVDAGGKARWQESSANRLEGIRLAQEAGRKIDLVHLDLLKVCGARR